MLLTHSILSASFLMTFFAMATPIPTPPHLLPRFLAELPSDPVLTRETAVTLASLTTARQVRDAPEAVPQIGTRSVPQEAPTTTTIEKRMEDGSAPESLKDNQGNEHKRGSRGYYMMLFIELDKHKLLLTNPKAVTPDKKEFGDSLQKIVSDLPIIQNKDVVKEILDFFSKNRVTYKKIVGVWPSASETESSPEQKAAVEAIRNWEEQLKSGINERKLEQYHLRPFGSDLNLMMDAIENNKDRPEMTPERVKGMIDRMPGTVLEMSIDETRKLHSKLEEVATRVDGWKSAWPKDGNWRYSAHWTVEEKLKALRKYNLVFNSESTTTTLSTAVTT